MTGRRALPFALSTLALLACGCGATTFPGSSHVLGVTSIDWSREPHPMATRRDMPFESDAPASTLSRLVPAGLLPVRRDYFDAEPAVRLEAMCTAPCTPTLWPGWYIVTGGDVVQTKAFKIPDDAEYVRVKAGGSQTMREIGIGVTFLGAALLAAGGLAALTPGPRDAGVIGLLASGGVAIGLGLPFWLLNPSTQVSFGAAASSSSR